MRLWMDRSPFTGSHNEQHGANFQTNDLRVSHYFVLPWRDRPPSYCTGDGQPEAEGNTSTSQLQPKIVRSAPTTTKVASRAPPRFFARASKRPASLVRHGHGSQLLGLAQVGDRSQRTSGRRKTEGGDPSRMSAAFLSCWACMPPATAPHESSL